MTVYKIVEKIGESPVSEELRIIETTVRQLKGLKVEVKRRVTAISNTIVLITLEIIFNNVTTFHSQAEISTNIEEDKVEESINNIDKQFLSEIIKFALTYKSISAKDYHDLQIYKRKYGNLN